MKRLEASHGIICSVPDSVLLGYFGWPSVAKLKDGSLAAVVSGFRAAHICACGKTVLFTSKDQGTTWDIGQIINDSMADDRDAGVIELADGRLVISWFSSDIRHYINDGNRGYYRPTMPVLEALDDEDILHYIGAFLRFRNTDGIWDKPQKVLVSAPHGPIQLKNGDIFYIGSQAGELQPDGRIAYRMGDLHHGLLTLRSSDGGKSWKRLGTIPCENNYFEPHAIELKDGRILAMIRQNSDFSILKTFSADGGATWSTPEQIGFGSPPHLVRASNGVLVCSYGWRKEKDFGQRVMFSKDEGATWDTDWIIRDDADSADLGYPCTVQLDDGSMYTVYYQHVNGCRNASLMYSRWQLPDEYK